MLTLLKYTFPVQHHSLNSCHRFPDGIQNISSPSLSNPNQKGSLSKTNGNSLFQPGWRHFPRPFVFPKNPWLLVLLQQLLVSSPEIPLLETLPSSADVGTFKKVCRKEDVGLRREKPRAALNPNTSTHAACKTPFPWQLQECSAKETAALPPSIWQEPSLKANALFRKEYI